MASAAAQQQSPGARWGHGQGTYTRPVTAMRRSAPSAARSAMQSEAGDYYVDARSTPVDGYDQHRTIQHLHAQLAA